MNRCPNCGNKLNDIDVLCPKCGAFVEVVQAGSSTDAVVTNNESINPPAKKEPRPELIVYNEDFPLEDITPSDDNIFPSDASEDDDKSLSDDFVQDDTLSDTFKTEEPDVPAVSSDESHENMPDDLPPLDESVYSESYLNAIKSMRLPEVEDLNDFDPDTFIREYMQSKNTHNIPSDKPAPSSEHNTTAESIDRKPWLEIEEVDSDALPHTEASSAPKADDADFKQNAPDVDEQEAPDASEQQMSDMAEPDAPDDVVPSQDTSLRRRRNRNDFVGSDETEPHTKKTPKRFPVLIALFWVVLTAVIFFGFVIFDHYVHDTYGSYSDMVKSITNGKVILNADEAYLETTSVSTTKALTEDGSSAHLFLIDSPVSDSVTIWPLGISFPLINGQTEVTVADDLIYQALGIISPKTQYTSNDVLLEFHTQRTSYIYPVQELVLEVAPTKYVRSQPTQAFLSTTNASIDIVLNVGPHTTVIINGTDYTNDISASGTLSINLGLSLGDNEFLIESQQPGKATVTDTFQVTRQMTQTVLLPDTDYLRIYSDTFTCHGATDSDATVTAVIDGNKTFHAEVDSNGTYALSCSVGDYGLHNVSLTADSEWRNPTNAEMLVEYIPDINTFIQNAKAVSLDDAAVADTSIRISGILTSLNSDMQTQTFTITDGADALLCYYHGTTQLEDGKDYLIYGMFDTDADAFYAMYIQ